MLCIVLGMGLPTTANYLVVASLLGGVLVELGSAAGLVLPLIAVHLYVLYYGLLADSTPPVCLAAFAASAISRADPLKTGVQSFLYDIRTAVLPLVFLFNTELLLIGVESVWHGVLGRGHVAARHPGLQLPHPGLDVRPGAVVRRCAARRRLLHAVPPRLLHGPDRAALRAGRVRGLRLRRVRARSPAGTSACT